MPPLADALRVICLGGSTTECLFLDNADAWTSRLMSQLNGAASGRYWVGSAGRSGYASGHHLRFLAESPLVDHAAAVVVLVGIEDLMRHLMQLDAGQTPPPLVLRTCTAQLVAEIWNARLGHGLAVGPTGRDYAHNRHGLIFPAWPTDPSFDDAVDLYRHRLREIVAVARRRRIRLLFVTQPVLWGEDLSGQALSRLAIARSFPKPPPWKYLTPENLRRAIDQYNDAIREVAADEDITCVDAAAEMNGRAEFFYDDYHFTREGAAMLAQLVAEELRASDELGQRRHVGEITQQGWREGPPEPAL
ncbi:MAG: SGNH/GDSL hydrolase family protein [Pirellulales bacterium]